MSGKYYFKRGRLILQEHCVGVNIDIPFNPQRIPMDISSSIGTNIDLNSNKNIRIIKCESNGVLHGEYCSYRIDGLCEHRCFYDDGKLTGPSIFYDKQGYITSETWFYNNLRQGRATQYNHDHRVCSFIYYCNGARHDVQNIYYLDGQLKARINYVFGKLNRQMSLYWNNGIQKRDVRFLNGKREGLDCCWNRDGKLSISTSFVGGHLVSLTRYSL